MKLIIRDENPKEKTCEIWLELDADGDINICSRLNDGPTLTEVTLYSDFVATHSSNTGNFKWADD